MTQDTGHQWPIGAPDRRFPGSEAQRAVQRGTPVAWQISAITGLRDRRAWRRLLHWVLRRDPPTITRRARVSASAPSTLFLDTDPAMNHAHSPTEPRTAADLHPMRDNAASQLAKVDINMLRQRARSCRAMQVMSMAEVA